MAFDGFLQILDAQCKTAFSGEALDKKFKGAIQLNSFELETQVDLASRDLVTSSSDKESYFTFTIEKDVDAATPFFFQYYARNWAATTSPEKMKGKNEGKISKAMVTLRKAAGKEPLEYMVFEFYDVWVKSWEIKSDADALPEEQVEFAFNALRINYFPQRSSGARGVLIDGAWNFGVNSDQEGKVPSSTVR